MNKNQLKKISSLKISKYRKLHGLFIAEGTHIVDELFKSDWLIDSLIATHKAIDSTDVATVLETAVRRKISVEIVPQREFLKISTTDSPQGVMAAVKLPQTDLKLLSGQRRILIADRISDPGNLGTMIRSAAAFGFGGFISTAGSADIFNPKTVRATQGALFHMTVANHISPNEIARQMRTSHRVYSLSPRGRVELEMVRPASRSVLVVGAEITGVSRELLEITDSTVRIQISDKVESLNAAVAAAIAMKKFYLS